jgi:hypothetical protein
MVASHRVISKVRVYRLVLAPALILPFSLVIFMAGCASIEPVGQYTKRDTKIEFVAPLEQRNKNYYKMPESVTDNRFVATGPIVSISGKPSGVSIFYIKIEKTHKFMDFNYIGDRVEGLSVPVESYFGIPGAITVDKRATLLLRIRGIGHSRYFTLEGVLPNRY